MANRKIKISRALVNAYLHHRSLVNDSGKGCRALTAYRSAERDVANGVKRKAKPSACGGY